MSEAFETLGGTFAPAWQRTSSAGCATAARPPAIRCWRR